MTQQSDLSVENEQKSYDHMLKKTQGWPAHFLQLYNFEEKKTD